MKTNGDCTYRPGDMGAGQWNVCGMSVSLGSQRADGRGSVMTIQKYAPLGHVHVTLFGKVSLQWSSKIWR